MVTFMPKSIKTLYHSCLRSFVLKWLILLCAFCLVSCSRTDTNSKRAPPDLNMVISVSTDGHYAIATNTNKQAILWDLKDHHYKIIFDDANIYSAYFIKNTDDFMYQNDKTNEVTVENVNGQIVKTFNPGFPVYSEVMTSDLTTYVASDENYQTYWFKNGLKKIILYYFCSTNFGDKIPPKGAAYTCGGIEGLSKNLTFDISSNQKYLVGAGSGEIFVWDLNSGHLLKHLIKNDAQTVAAISPDGSYALTADTDGNGVFYNLSSEKLLTTFAYTSPPDPQTQLFFSNDANFLNTVFTVKFIDSQHLLVFFANYPDLFYFATLYNPKQLVSINYPSVKYGLKPIKYLPLISDAATNFYSTDHSPLATGDDFSRDQAIDTSPSAHILVMSQQNANGIIVYQYDPEHQTLTRTWSAVVIKKPWWQLN